MSVYPTSEKRRERREMCLDCLIKYLSSWLCFIIIIIEIRQKLPTANRKTNKQLNFLCTGAGASSMSND